MEIFVVGPAGSGKSTLVKSFAEFLREKGYEVCCVNLDPATDAAYEAEADIRKLVRTEDVMEKYCLGINGALLKSMELAMEFSKELRCPADFTLYDAPGQMELFIYSDSGRKMVQKLSGQFSCSLFLMDSNVVKDVESFIATILQNVIVSLRLSLPTLTVFTKVDLVDPDIDRIQKNITEGKGVLAELLEKTVFFIEYTTIPYRPVKVSSIKKTGFEDLFSAINELFCACGDIS